MTKKEYYSFHKHEYNEKIIQIAEEVKDRLINCPPLSDQIHDTIRGVVKARFKVPREDEYSEFNKKIYSEVTSKLKHFL